jgi:hypothetical protein
MPGMAKKPQKPSGWTDTAPIRVEHHLPLGCSADVAFGVLADHEGWTGWFKGMRKVRVDGPATGVGAKRTVWVGPTRVTEVFTAWEPGQRMAFDIVEATIPGVSAMSEDWRLTPTGETSCDLDVLIAVEPGGLLGKAPGVLRFAMARATSGAAGIQAHVAGRR